MNTGDAEATVWLEPGGDRHWCLEISSKRRGKVDGPRWDPPVYKWHVELWRDGDDDASLTTSINTAPTFAEAMRLARRWAESLERAARRSATGR